MHAVKRLLSICESRRRWEIKITLVLILFLQSCVDSGSKKGKLEEKQVVVEITEENDPMENYETGTYGYDLELLKKYTDPVELKNGDSRLVLSLKYQGRIMTSSSDGNNGRSYGWINHELIESGKVLEQFNPVGGEERFWLGPEGGQYSLFFKPGSSFDFENWSVPACIDTEPFIMYLATDSSAVFTQTMKVKNFSNFEFQFDVTRKVELLGADQISKKLKVSLTDNVKWVGYETTNIIRNTGRQPWRKETGLISIWLLGMFKPSPSVTMIIPFKQDVQAEYSFKDDYFGKIPENRLKVVDDILYFKGDGKQRGKVGIPPETALPLIGSYDSGNKILTIVKADISEEGAGYVNSAWEYQENPYQGDAINAYNDGPLENGSQLGPFYELESSSPGLELECDSSATYIQSTYHFEGPEAELNVLCQQIFNVSLDEIKTVF